MRLRLYENRDSHKPNNMFLEIKNNTQIKYSINALEHKVKKFSRKNRIKRPETIINRRTKQIIGKLI